MAGKRQGSRLGLPVLAFCLVALSLHGSYAANGLAVQQSVSSPQADENFRQALLALKESRFGDAITLLTAAKRSHPEDARIRNFLGIALAAAGQSSAAAGQYREAIRLAPAMEDAYRNLGFLEWNQHQLEAAARDLARAVDLSPQDSFAHYYLGRVYLEAQRYRDAVEQLQASQALWPDDTEFLLEAARGYAAVSRPDVARTLLARLSKHPLSEAQVAQASSLLLQLHENASAIALLEQASPSKPALKPWARFDVALAELTAGDYAQARRDAQQYVEILSQSGLPPAHAAAAWCLIGVANARAGQAEDSVTAFRRAAELAPGQEENWLNLTRELMELSRYSEAISAVRDGLAAKPKSYALHLRLGAAQMAAGHYAEAEAVFRDLVAAGDPLPTSYVGLAQVLLRVGRAGEAASELGAARQKLGPNFLISYFLGLALERMGKSAEALAAFQQAAQLDPGSAQAHIGIGKNELALGQVKEAIAELQNALRLAPQDVQARRLLSTAYRRAGDLQNAAKYAQSGAAAAQEIYPRDLIGDFFLPPWRWPAESARH